uniref:Uncharacterized protein n=1 Tax=Plectus sambesii TaxID=2011161 RepID=A0A914UN28_9BILA
MRRCCSWPQLETSAVGDGEIDSAKYGGTSALFHVSQSSKSFDSLASPTDSGLPPSEVLDVSSPGIRLMPEEEGGFFSETREETALHDAAPSFVGGENGENAENQPTPTPQISVDSGGSNVDMNVDANVDTASLNADDTLPSTTITTEDDEPSSSGDSRCSSTPPAPAIVCFGSAAGRSFDGGCRCSRRSTNKAVGVPSVDHDSCGASSSTCARAPLATGGAHFRPFPSFAVATAQCDGALSVFVCHYFLKHNAVVDGSCEIYGIGWIY